LPAVASPQTPVVPREPVPVPAEFFQYIGPAEDKLYIGNYVCNLGCPKGPINYVRSACNSRQNLKRHVKVKYFKQQQSHLQMSESIFFFKNRTSTGKQNWTNF
jgi:hypothetical protein